MTQEILEPLHARIIREKDYRNVMDSLMTLESLVRAVDGKNESYVQQYLSSEANNVVDEDINDNPVTNLDILRQFGVVVKDQIMTDALKCWQTEFKEIGFAMLLREMNEKSSTRHSKSGVKRNKPGYLVDEVIRGEYHIADGIFFVSKLQEAGVLRFVDGKVVRDEHEIVEFDFKKFDALWQSYKERYGAVMDAFDAFRGGQSDNETYYYTGGLQTSSRRGASIT